MMSSTRFEKVCISVTTGTCAFSLITALLIVLSDGTFLPTIESYLLRPTGKLIVSVLGILGYSKAVGEFTFDSSLSFAFVGLKLSVTLGDDLLVSWLFSMILGSVIIGATLEVYRI